MASLLRLMAGLVSGGLIFVGFQPPASMLRIVVYSFAAWSYAWVSLRIARELER